VLRIKKNKQFRGIRIWAAAISKNVGVEHTTLSKTSKGKKENALIWDSSFNVAAFWDKR
jgi:hypothetical protein